MSGDDPYRLERFLQAQNDVYDAVVRELRAGHKRSHWMWFVFPQLRGLGRSSTAEYYAITGRDEASAYLRHPVLGARLLECTRLVASATTDSVVHFLGPVDALKLRSSMTLFARTDPTRHVFLEVLDQYYDGEPDPATDTLLDA